MASDSGSPLSMIALLDQARSGKRAEQVLIDRVGPIPEETRKRLRSRLLDEIHEAIGEGTPG